MFDSTELVCQLCKSGVTDKIKLAFKICVIKRHFGFTIIILYRNIMLKHV